MARATWQRWQHIRFRMARTRSTRTDDPGSKGGSFANFVRSPLFVVYLLIVNYAMCYQLQQPLEPFLVSQLVKGDDATAAFARQKSFFALVQLVGSLLVGYLIDKLGVRAMFMANFLACAACYALLASATSLEILYASKVPAIFQAGFLCAQAAVAKLTKPGEERAAALGRLTSAYTVGGMVGPALGGYLGREFAAKFAVVGSAAAVALVLMLPAEIDGEVATEGKDGGKSKGKAAAEASGSWVSRMGRVLPIVWPLLLTKFVAGFVNSAAASARPLLLKNTFNFDQATAY